tara:strand:- start:97223 stop:97990 length:768 start_codon:yes stop_codon:yes gene_type:complete
MRPIYILIITLLLSTASSYAQLEGLLGDIMEEVQEKVGDAQQDAAETASMKEFKNEIKDILVGINGLDKYSSELKCIYIILKLAMLDQDLEAKIQNAGNCKKKYDLYGMQLMVKASYTGIGYCFDPLTELITQRDPNASDDSILLTPELEEFFEEYEEISRIALTCVSTEFIDGPPDGCESLSGVSDLEIDFIMTVGIATALYDFAVYDMGEEGSSARKGYILIFLKYLIEEYNPVAALAKSINIGSIMSSLPCK